MAVENEIDKRFLCFAFCEYYPVGGMEDMSDSFDNLENAINHLKDDLNDYRYIYDRIEGKTIIID